jgi:hypothetical protein
MWNYLKSKWQSLVFRLLFYFLVSLLALAVVLGISFTKRIKPHVQNEILPNVERYIEYLIDDIGVPPDLATAARLAEELPFELRIEGQGIDWSSSPLIRAIGSHDFRPAPPPYSDVYLSHHRRAEYLLIEKQGYQRVSPGFRAAPRGAVPVPGFAAVCAVYRDSTHVQAGGSHVSAGTQNRRRRSRPANRGRG